MVTKKECEASYLAFKYKFSDGRLTLIESPEGKKIRRLLHDLSCAMTFHGYHVRKALRFGGQDGPVSSGYSFEAREYPPDSDPEGKGFWGVIESEAGRLVYVEESARILPGVDSKLREFSYTPSGSPKTYVVGYRSSFDHSTSFEDHDLYMDTETCLEAAGGAGEAAAARLANLGRVRDIYSVRDGIAAFRQIRNSVNAFPSVCTYSPVPERVTIRKYTEIPEALNKMLTEVLGPIDPLYPFKGDR